MPYAVALLAFLNSIRTVRFRTALLEHPCLGSCCHPHPPCCHYGQRSCCPLPHHEEMANCIAAVAEDVDVSGVHGGNLDVGIVQESRLIDLQLGWRQRTRVAYNIKDE